VVAVAVGFGHSLALRKDGTVWGWGSNFLGQLGTGTGLDHLVPVRTLDLTDVVAIDSRDDSSYAVRADGTAWGWGLNNVGQLGLPPENDIQPVPAQVPGVTRVVSLAASSGHALAVRRDGTVCNGAGGAVVRRSGEGLRQLWRPPGPAAA